MTTDKQSTRVLVTGANGFLGRYVVAQLLEQKDAHYSVRCLVRVGSQLNGLDPDRVEVVRASLDDANAIPGVLEGVDIVVHLAASKGGSPMGMFAETVVSTEKLMACIASSGVRKLVFCSSFSVYGASQLPTDATFDESCPIEPQPNRRDPYAWCKYYQEQWIKSHANDIDLVIVRPGVIFGEDQGLLSPRVGMHLPGLPIFLKIGGRAKVPLTHVDNCADLIAKAALLDSVKNDVFNAVDDDCPKQSEYLALYEEHIGKIRNKLPLPYPLFLFASWSYDLLHRLSNGNFPAIFSAYKARSMYRRFEFSNAHAKNVLGWSPRLSLQDAIKESAAFIKEQEPV